MTQEVKAEEKKSVLDIMHQLRHPFDANSIKFRWDGRKPYTDKEGRNVGGVLAYIDARDVMDRLDAVVGPHNWQDDSPYKGCHRIAIKVAGEWVWKSDNADETNIEASKGESSTAFKRAAVKWGVGRYLYSLKGLKMVMQEAGRGWSIMYRLSNGADQIGLMRAKVEKMVEDIYRVR